MNKKIRIAFIKYGGLSSGGTEKMLQIIAANLPKNRFAVDFFYCDSSPYIGSNYIHPSTDNSRVRYMTEHGVNCIEFKVGFKDVTTPTHNWLETDFWKKFNEEKYDIIQTGRSGHKEYPFTKIKKTPIIEIIALSSGVDNQYNLSRVLHICKWSADGWVARGGDKRRVEIISLPVEINFSKTSNLRDQLNLSNKFIYGMHQRPSNEIFSDIPLRAYKNIETDDTAFILMGGGEMYKKQAMDLDIKNIHFLPASGDMKDVCDFLSTLNVYAHGRKDGEVNSQAMAEAMYFGLPIVSHLSSINNGHVECIRNAGLVVKNVEEYAEELKKIKMDPDYYLYRSKKSKENFIENYELKKQIQRFIDIYESVLEKPFTNPKMRLLTSLHWTQNVLIWIKWLHLKFKYLFLNKV